MKRVLICLLLVAMLPLGLLGVGAALPEYYGGSYYAELPGMAEKLKTTDGPKVVIVGGSSVAFGVDSELMEQVLGQCGYEYTVCNFGLYAAVGTSAMLELSKNYVNENDIVILAIEPTSETFSTYFGATAFWKCAESDPEMLLDLNKSQQSAMVGNYLGYLQERLAIRRTGILPEGEGAYAKAAFDDNCNMTFHRAGNAMALGYDSGNLIDLAAVEFETAFLEQVAAFCETDAQVYFSFAPMNRGALADGSEEAVYDFFLRCQESFPCRIISDPNDYILDSGWFYDTNFHLNSSGAELRTVRLAEDLLAQLGYFGPLEYELPQIPESIAVLESGESDSEDFLFEAIGDRGYRVSGLTETGMAKTSLILPGAHNGEPVVGFTADTFAGNRVLTELTIPSSIETIPDGAFSGCTGLSRVNLLHTGTTPAVGEGLLEGTEDLTFYVPAASYHLYRDGAGCASNPWEQYLDRIVTY